MGVGNNFSNSLFSYSNYNERRFEISRRTRATTQLIVATTIENIYM